MSKHVCMVHDRLVIMSMESSSSTQHLGIIWWVNFGCYRIFSPQILKFKYHNLHLTAACINLPHVSYLIFRKSALASSRPGSPLACKLISLKVGIIPVKGTSCSLTLFISVKGFKTCYQNRPSKAYLAQVLI